LAEPLASAWSPRSRSAVTLGRVVAIELRDDPDEPGAAEAYVVATVAGHEYRLILDTGGARSTLPLDGLTSTFPRVDVDDEPGRGALGPASADTGRVVVPSLALGPLQVRDLVVDRAPEGSVAPTILGLDVMRGHRLELRLAGAMLGIDTDAPADAARPLPMSSRSHPYVVVGWGEVEATALSPPSIRSCSSRCPRRPAPTRPETAPRRRWRGWRRARSAGGGSTRRSRPSCRFAGSSERVIPSST
jgi:Aspartyl protease